MRAWAQSGLAALLVLAPALCCCSVRGLVGLVTESAAPPARPSCPEPVAEPTKKSCCHDAEPASPAPKPAHPAPPAGIPDCKCLGERLDATAPEAAPTVAEPEPTGELLPSASAVPAAVAPEHLGLLGGLDPPERAGVDARSDALFSRHVLRC